MTFLTETGCAGHARFRVGAHSPRGVGNAFLARMVAMKLNANLTVGERASRPAGRKAGRRGAGGAGGDETATAARTPTDGATRSHQ